MTVPSTARRTSTFQASALVTGFLVVMSFAAVLAFAPVVLFGIPLLVAAAIARRARRTARVLAAIPSAVIVVWWVVYNATVGFRIEDPWTDTWFLLAGPAAAITVPAGILGLAASRRDRFSEEPVRA